MRTAFINQLVEEAKINDKIFLVVGDLGYSVVEPFAELFPDRFLNAGVAEQNMTGVAAGLAMEGYNVFTYSIANFPTLRCMEQIRYDVCYHNLNVKVVSVGGGYAYAALGASHHATEDIGMMRTIPNIIVSAPGDPCEAKALTTFFSNYYGPAYLRLGKAGEPMVHQNKIEFKAPGALKVKERGSTAILSTGGVLKYCFDFANANQNDFSLYSFPFIKPIDFALLKFICSNYKNIITVEEHQRSGGFGSAILEAINDLLEKNELTSSPLIKRLAIPDTFMSVAGTQEYLRQKAGIMLS